MADIFISYSKEEPKTTERLAQALQQRGYSVWWDVTLVPGEDFSSVIQQRLLESRVAIVIWSKSSIRSRWVRSEAQIADRLQKLIPVRTRDVANDEIPPPYNILHTELADNVEAIISALAARGISPVSATSKLHDPRKPRAFISCRSQDATAAGRLQVLIQKGVPELGVVVDTPAVAHADLEDAIGEIVSSCDILLLLIGQNWSSTSENLIDQSSDAVRVAIRAALKAKTLIIPVLLDAAELPKASELPTDIREIAFRNAIRLGNLETGQGGALLIAFLSSWISEARGTNSIATKPRPGIFARIARLLG